MRTLFIILIPAYQVVISPMLPRSCKYYPSCSQYGLEAVREFGAIRGMVLAGWRILRCNPFSLGGYDPVQSQKLFASRHVPPPGPSDPAPDTAHHRPGSASEGAPSGTDGETEHGGEPSIDRRPGEKTSQQRADHQGLAA
jgi:uncharacterized protein